MPATMEKIQVRLFARRSRFGRILFSLFGALLLAGSQPVSSETPSRRLPDTVVHDLCKKYDGKAAFDSKDERTRIDCDWIQKMSVLTQSTPIETYRAILDHAVTLADLRNAKFPADIDCGGFDVQVVGDTRAIVCKGDPGGAVPYVFLAGPTGMIFRMETILDYKNNLRAALRKSADKGEISTFYTAFVELSLDIMVAKLRYSATPFDSIRLENGKISISMQASGNFSLD